MAHFRGIISGNRGDASQLGSKASGLQTEAASWQGTVVVHLYEQDGIDFARVSLQTHYGRGTSKMIYDGPVGGECVWDTTERKARGVAWSPTWSAV